MTERVGVVVPAHDEAELVGACIAALRVAADEVSVPVDVVVVLDTCTDATADIVRDLAVRAITVEARNVGAARAAGFASLDHCSWLATTDADTLVPAHWVARQLAYAAQGYDAVVGTVRVASWVDRPADIAERFSLRYSSDHGHPHVHGANLGFSRAAYRAAGPVPPAAVAEDVALVAALERSGARIARAGDLAVITSARRRSRVRGGFADYLTGLETATA